MSKLLPLLLAAAALAGGCAPKSWDSEYDGAYDPMEKFNRSSYKVSKGLDNVVMKPAAGAYNRLPAPVRSGFRNFFHNLEEPGNIVNNALQKKGKGALNSTARFVFNTVFGLGGLLDVSSRMDLPRAPASFGQTIRGFGVNNTAYLYLPMTGPTTLADGVGAAADTFTRPQNYRIHVDAVNVINATEGLVKRADLLETTDLIEATALDEYLFVRDAYEDSRRHDTPTGMWKLTPTGLCGFFCTHSTITGAWGR